MSTTQGLPGQILHVHFIVVLAPLAAVLAVLCALWPAAGQHLTWHVLIVAAVTTALTPLTTTPVNASSGAPVPRQSCTPTPN